MKLCKDCKHYDRGSFLYFFKFPKCKNTINPVDGKSRYHCDTERMFPTLGCGPSGKNWEAK